MRRWWVAALALAVVAGGAGATTLLQQPAEPTAGPRPTPSPDPVRTPLLSTPPLTGAPTTAGLTRALATALRDPALGRLGLSVLDSATGKPLLERDAGTPKTPASTTKIVTALAALTVLEPTATFSTRLVEGAAGDLVLVGGGDPSLTGRYPATDGFGGATLRALAAQTQGRTVRRIVVDDGLFTGPRLGPGWKPGYVTSGDVAPVSSLQVDGGRSGRGKSQPRVADPALEAGRQLAALLRVGTVVRGRAPAGALEVGQVSSPPVADLVEAMLTRSDNDYAEALGRQVALASGKPATFAGEQAAITAAVGPLLNRVSAPLTGVRLRDASGLSPVSLMSPAALSRLLALASTEDRYAAVLSGLPVGGFDGTLAKRFRTGLGAGQVRAKTGTLNGVSALAGLVRTRGGSVLSFAFAANGLPLSGTLAAQRALDRLATALAGCGCP